MKLVILDRDGVINEDSDQFVKSADEWLPIAGSIDAIARLYNNGFTIVIATNQSGIARGLFTLADLDAMHQKLHDLVANAGGKIAGIFYCPHGPDDNCDCRKPKAGLIDAIENELCVSAKGAPLVGDSLRDLESGLSKACVPLLVKTGKGSKTLDALNKQTEHAFSQLPVFDNLAASVDYIVENF